MPSYDELYPYPDQNLQPRYDREKFWMSAIAAATYFAIIVAMSVIAYYYTTFTPLSGVCWAALTLLFLLYFMHYAHKAYKRRAGR